jgi:hypothetical protein
MSIRPLPCPLAKGPTVAPCVVVQQSREYQCDLTDDHKESQIECQRNNGLRSEVQVP